MIDESDPPLSSVPSFDMPTQTVPHSQTISPGGVDICGFAIWFWDAVLILWTLIEDKSEDGFEPGDGPTGPGRFHGQTVRWASQPKTN